MGGNELPPMGDMKRQVANPNASQDDMPKVPSKAPTRKVGKKEEINVVPSKAPESNKDSKKADIGTVPSSKAPESKRMSKLKK